MEPAGKLIQLTQATKMWLTWPKYLLGTANGKV